MSLPNAMSPATNAISKCSDRPATKAFCALLAAIAISVASAPVFADCMRDLKGRVICDRGHCVRDSYGMVYCSQYEDGAALKNLYGEVLCGKGACVTTIKGDIICSARPGGAAMKDLYGT